MKQVNKNIFNYILFFIVFITDIHTFPVSFIESVIKNEIYIDKYGLRYVYDMYRKLIVISGPSGSMYLKFIVLIVGKTHTITLYESQFEKFDILYFDRKEFGVTEQQIAELLQQLCSFYVKAIIIDHITDLKEIFINTCIIIIAI